jgi:hypothetical protein
MKFYFEVLLKRRSDYTQKGAAADIKTNKLRMLMKYLINKIYLFHAYKSPFNLNRMQIIGQKSFSW